jgi:hypothetical protein
MCAFISLNVVVAATMNALAVSYFYVQGIHLCVLLGVCLVCVYNGGTFYFHAFSDDYSSKFFAPKPWTLEVRARFPLPFLIPIDQSEIEKPELRTPLESPSHLHLHQVLPTSETEDAGSV